MKFCDCFDGYTGKNCELVTVHRDAGESHKRILANELNRRESICSVNIVKYVGNIGGVLTIITIFLTILFGILLCKEK